jgi:hypothetical protein
MKHPRPVVARVPLALGALTLVLAACDPPQTQAVFPVTFGAVSDPGVSLGGVQLTANGAPIGETAEDGSLHVELTGPEGSVMQIGAQCPEGFRQPVTLPQLTLRRVVSLDPAVADRGLQVSIACPPMHRSGVIVVRAGREQPAAGVPVLLDGREVARTDESGAAHIPIEMQPGAQFQVLLATAGLPLRPTNPQLMFTFPDHDELFVFDQGFEVTEAPRRRVRPRVEVAPTGPRLPQKIVTPDRRHR